MSLLSAIATAAKLKLPTVEKVGCVGDLTGYIDTGSYAMNALLSGSIYGGFHSNKITGLNGASGVGKTWYLLQALEYFIKAHPENVAVIFDAETAITTDTLKSRGIDISRVSFLAVSTVEQFRTLAIQIINGYAESTTPEQRKTPRLFLGLDSLGQLSTIKETTDITDGNDKNDMTKAKLIRGAFRVLNIAQGINNVPMLITNHIYTGTGGYGPTTTSSGGGGLIYACTTILDLTKKREKDENGVTGAIISVKTAKARFTKEQQVVETVLNFDNGLDRYAGLFEIGCRCGVFVKEGIKWKLPDGTKEFSNRIEAKIKATPEAFYTKELLDAIDKACGKLFLYQVGEKPLPIPELEAIDAELDAEEGVKVEEE
jgi:RecA/RadA recombinase